MTSDITRSRAARIQLAVVLGLLSCIGPLAVDAYLPAFPAIVDDLRASESALQQSVGIYFVGLASGQLILGPVSDRLGRRWPLMFGAVVLMIGSLGCAFATDASQLIFWRLVQAIGGCAAMVISRAIVRDLFEPREGARFYSYMMLIGGLAPVLAPIIGGALLITFGWRSIFWFLALYGVLWLALVIMFLPESLPAEKRHPVSFGEVLRRYGLLLRDRQFVLYSLSGSLISAMMFAYIAGSPFVFMNLHGVKPEHFGFFFGANALGIMTLGQINRSLVVRYDMNRILRLVLCVAATAACLVCLATLTGWFGFPGILVPLFFAVASMGMVMPLATALAMAPHGAMAGNASALFGVMMFGISGLSGFAVSALHNGTAWPMGIIIAVCGTGALIANIVLRPKFAGRN